MRGIDSRDVVEGVDDDEAECDEEDDPGGDDVGGDEEGDPRHDDEDGGRQVDVQQVRRHAPRQVDLQAVHRVVACKSRERWEINLRGLSYHTSPLYVSSKLTDCLKYATTSRPNHLNRQRKK